MKNNKKGLLKRIKWENITFIIMLIISVISIIHHIKLNGLYFNLILEVFTYSMFSLFFRYIVKDIRKNPQNWTL
jgi:hypothetical protein